MRLLAAVLGALVALAAPAGQVGDATRFLQSRELPGGGFAEPGGERGAALTAWAVLGLRSAGVTVSADTRDYLARARSESPTDAALLALAHVAAGGQPREHVERVRRLQRPSGAIGPTVNSTAWGVLALRQARAPVSRATIAWLLGRQARSGGWSWFPRGAPDSNDTAAVVEALAACGVKGRPIERALAFLRRLQNRDGGFELTLGRGSDTQSTAWAVQAFLAAGRPSPRGAFAYLARMRRADGSLRYSARYVTTPVWVTAQALPALAQKPFPLR